ncbi:MAG: hypothetical protein ACP5O6_11445 [Candidatus Baltobacteraceae bacterium]
MDSPQPSPDKPEKKKPKGLAAVLAALAALAAKFKAFLLLFFHMPILLGSFSFLATLWLYGLTFGWRFGIILALVLLAHELGHVLAFRNYGLAVGAPVFLPFIGALTPGSKPATEEDGAYIALAGPLAGMGLAAAALAMGLATHDPFWMLAANISALLNLFNMAPVLPLDGGRIIQAVWPPIVVLALPIFLIVAVLAQLPLLPIALIALFSVVWLAGSWRTALASTTNGIGMSARIRVGLAYAGTLLGLLFIEARIHLPALAALHR